MKIPQDTPFIDDIKSHYGLEGFDEDSQSLPINGHFVFIVQVKGTSAPTLILCTSIGEIPSQEQLPDMLQRAMSYQLHHLSQTGAALSLAPEGEFLALQKMIYPETADQACREIDDFTAMADDAGTSIFSADFQELQER